MAEKTAEEKKPGDDQSPPTSETILEKSTEDGVAEAEAELSVRSFVREALERFTSSMQDAFDALAAFAQSQADFGSVYNQAGFFSFIGDRVVDELLGAAPGPIMQGLVHELSTQISMASSSGSDLATFVSNGLVDGCNNASWYARDNIESLVGDQWRDLLGLAGDGANQFIAGLYQLGLPTMDFDGQQLGQRLEAHAEAYKQAMGTQRDQVTEDQAKPDEKVEEQAQEDMALDETKKETQEAAAG